MMLLCKYHSDVPRRKPVFCKFQEDVTKTIADVLQDLNRRHKDITAQVNQSECFASSQQNSQPIRRCFASSKQTSRRQSPMYCKVSTDVTKTIADVLQDLYRSHKDITAQVNQSECFASSQQNSQPIRRCFASSKQTSQRQSPMYCKVSTDVTKTIADVLQDLYRIHKDNRRCIARSL